jgi:hypothetical protein
VSTKIVACALGLALGARGCSDGGVRVGALPPDAAPADAARLPPDAPVIQPDAAGIVAELTVTAAPDVAWAATGRTIVGPLLVLILGEPAVNEVLANLEPTGLLMPQQRACYLLSRNDGEALPGVALDFSQPMRSDCLVRTGVVLVRAPGMRGVTRVDLPTAMTVGGRTVEGTLRLVPTADHAARLATAEPFQDPPAAFVDSCDGTQLSRCLRVCDPAGACVAAGLTGNLTWETMGDRVTVTLSGTGAVLGLVGAGATDVVNERFVLGTAESVVPLACEELPEEYSPRPVQFEGGPEGPSCPCPGVGTLSTTGGAEYAIEVPCAEGTSLRFTQSGPLAGGRLKYAGCGPIETTSFCAGEAMLQIPAQVVKGCPNECLALGCQVDLAAGTCTCQANTVRRGPRHNVFALDPRTAPALGAAVQAGCAPL